MGSFFSTPGQRPTQDQRLQNNSYYDPPSPPPPRPDSIPCPDQLLVTPTSDSFSDLQPLDPPSFYKRFLKYIHNSYHYVLYRTIFEHHRNGTWVYARFVSRRNDRQAFYAFNLDAGATLQCPKPTLELMGSATAVREKKLYMIGGLGQRNISWNHVYSCDLPSFRWERCPHGTNCLRQDALAVVAMGRFFLFGGNMKPSRLHRADWVESYDPQGFCGWLTLRLQTVDGDDARLPPPFKAVVIEDRIFLRNPTEGFVIDINRPWRTEKASAELIQHWFWSTNAASLDGLIITCHVEQRQEEQDKYSVGAYVPESESWLKVEGVDVQTQESANLCQYMNLEGNLVIHNNPCSMFEMYRLDEKSSSIVRFSFVSRCLPLPKIDNRLWRLALAHPLGSIGVGEAHARSVGDGKQR